MKNETKFQRSLCRKVNYLKPKPIEEYQSNRNNNKSWHNPRYKKNSSKIKNAISYDLNV